MFLTTRLFGVWWHGTNYQGGVQLASYQTQPMHTYLCKVEGL